MTSLRAWLRKSPQPHRLRVRNADDEEREIQLSADARHRWKSAEEAILTMRAVAVECLDAAGAVIRAQQLEHDSDDEGESDSMAKREREYDKRRAAEVRGIADVLDRYGLRMTEAFEAGSNAASQGQAQLTGLVETLAANLSVAITNVHTLGTNFFNTLQGVLDQHAGGEESGGNKELLASVLQLATAHAAGKAASRPAPPSNGKGKP